MTSRTARAAHSKPRFHGQRAWLQRREGPRTRKHPSPHPRVLFPVVAAQSIDAPPLSGSLPG